MPDITIHIGYPKTATTYFQQYVWPLNFACAGKGGRRGPLKATGKKWTRLYHRDSADVWRRPVGRRVADALAAQAGDNELMLSNEALLKASVFLTHPGYRVFEPDGQLSAPVHLAAFARHAWGNRGRVRVLVTLRRQIEWLGSSYAQHSHIMPASQAHFEQRLRTFMGQGPNGPLRYLDYGRLVADLQSALGPANVAVLPYEDVKALGTAQALAAVFPGGLAVSQADTTPVNQRSTSGSPQGERGLSWRLRPKRRKGWRGLKNFGFQPRPDDKLVMADELAAELKAFFAPMNERLARLIDRADLQAYGYF